MCGLYSDIDSCDFMLIEEATPVIYAALPNHALMALIYDSLETQADR